MPTPPLALILTSVSTPEQAADSKQSLDTQERDLRAIAAEHGWKVLDVLRVPGFSRDYISWDECAQDMLKQGITAFADLKRYCDARAFDVFMVRDADRFGRTQSLVMQIAETIGMKLGKNIYSQMNGLVKPDNCRMWAMMAGYTAAAEMDKKKLYHHNGMEKRAERGFHESITPWFHRTVHDEETGKSLRVEVREDYRYVWDIVYQVIVNERVGFPGIEKYLFERYQLVNPTTGRPFYNFAIYNFLCNNPAFWGHRMRGKAAYKRKMKRAMPIGEWIYNPDMPPPDGIKMVYDAFPAVYTGQQAEAMKAELRRRAEMVGSRRPNNSAAFSGLVVCDYCHHHMIHLHKLSTGWRVMRCTVSQKLYLDHTCQSQRKSIPYGDLVAWMKEKLEQLIAGQPLDSVFPLPTQTVDDELITLEQQIEAVQQESTQLMARLGLIPDAMLPEFQRQMQAVAERAAALNTRHHELKTQQQTVDRRGQITALHDIDKIGLDAFWRLDESRQQQLLKLLFGKWRIIVADGEILGAAIVGRRGGRSTTRP